MLTPHSALTCVLRHSSFFEGHVLDFDDGFMTLSNSQLTLLASKLNMLESNLPDTALAVRRVIPEKLRYFVGLKAVRDAISEGRGGGIDLEPDTCAWNLLLRRRQVLTTRTMYGSKRDVATPHLKTLFCIEAAEDSRGRTKHALLFSWDR